MAIPPRMLEDLSEHSESELFSDEQFPIVEHKFSLQKSVNEQRKKCKIFSKEDLKTKWTKWYHGIIPPGDTVIPNESKKR